MSIADRFPVKGFIETSFIDWKGKLASVLFSGGCNFRCPFCHNSDLVLNHSRLEDVPFEYIILTLRKYRNWVENVVVTGGEPTIHMSLFHTVARIRGEGVRVKLDTNGSNPSVLKGLVDEGLIDCVAMDIKGPLDRYEKWCGAAVDKGKIVESIEFILEGAIDYEFRMTVVPSLHMEEDVYQVAEYIKDAKCLTIQEFKPRNTLDPSFVNVMPFSPDIIQRIRQNVSEILYTGQPSADKRRLQIVNTQEADMSKLP